jgi:hypothetical protein
MKYYNTLRMWNVRKDDDFRFVNSHEKRNVRDWSSRETLRRALRERINNSKHLLLIIGETTKFDTDWVPFEIEHAVDNCKIPIIAAYTGYNTIVRPRFLRDVWPEALKKRIDDGSARVIHVAFKKEPIRAAIERFDHANLPDGSLVHYTEQAYIKWGLG